MAGERTGRKKNAKDLLLHLACNPAMQMGNPTLHSRKTLPIPILPSQWPQLFHMSQDDVKDASYGELLWFLRVVRKDSEGDVCQAPESPPSYTISASRLLSTLRVRSLLKICLCHCSVSSSNSGGSSLSSHAPLSWCTAPDFITHQPCHYRCKTFSSQWGHQFPSIPGYLHPTFTPSCLFQQEIMVKAGL